MLNDNKIKHLTLNQLMTSPFETGGVIVNFSQNNMSRAGETYVLQPKVLELLLLLCCAQGETLTKQTLTQTLWPDTIVGPDSLANSMARLRKALGDDAKDPKFIQTVQRKGYRWLQPVAFTKPVSSMLSKGPVSVKYLVLSLLALGAMFAVIFLPPFFVQDEVEKFPFPDLAIKKLADGGYEIQVGIEGKLTPEKKAAMLKEIKRITGEEYSGMAFTVDPIKPNCESLDKSDPNKLAKNCQSTLKSKTSKK